MATLTYHNPHPMRFTLPGGKEITLIPGKTFDLPEDNDYIAALIEQGYLHKQGVAEPNAETDAPAPSPVPAPSKKRRST